MTGYDFRLPCKECGKPVAITDLVAQMWCGYCGRLDFCSKCKAFHIAPEIGCQYKDATTDEAIKAMYQTRGFTLTSK